MKLDILPIKDNFDTVAPIVAEAIKKYEIEEDVSVAEIDPSFSDTASFCEHYEWPPERGANCVVVEATRADINGLVRRHLGARKVSMAPMEEILTVTHMEYGGVTPIGLPGDWPILIDSNILSLEQVLVGGGNRSSKLIFPGRILERIPNVVPLENLGKPS